MDTRAELTLSALVKTGNGKEKEHFLKKYIPGYRKGTGFSVVVNALIIFSLVSLCCAFISKAASDPQAYAQAGPSNGEDTRLKDYALPLDPALPSDPTDAPETEKKEDPPEKNSQADAKSDQDIGTSAAS